VRGQNEPGRGAACQGPKEWTEDQVGNCRRGFACRRGNRIVSHFRGRIEHRDRGVVSEEMIGGEYVFAQSLVQRVQPPAGAANPSGQRGTAEIDAVPGKDLRLPITRRVIAIFTDQHLCERGWCGQPPAISRSGAAVCATLLQLRQAYFGRVMRMTRNCAGTQSSISLMLSPMAWNAPPQQPQISPSMASTMSSRGR
jgi:hypothetical protein